jgi:hypothetical protein
VILTIAAVQLLGLAFVVLWPMRPQAARSRPHWVRRACRWLARAWTGDLGRRRPRYLFAADADARAAYRRWMDVYYRNGVRRADRRWLRREMKCLARIAELYPDVEEAQR